MQQRTKRHKKVLHYMTMGLFFISIPVLAAVWVYFLWEKIPSQIHIMRGETEEFDFAIPATAQISKLDHSIGTVDLGKPVTLYGTDTDNYQMSIKLFGFIDFKETELSVIDEVELRPVGKPVGIYVKTKGILVIDSGEFE